MLFGDVSEFVFQISHPAINKHTALVIEIHRSGLCFVSTSFMAVLRGYSWQDWDGGRNCRGLDPGPPLCCIISLASEIRMLILGPAVLLHN